MIIIGALIPISLFLGGLGLCAFIWSLRSGQFDDLEGDQSRALFRDDFIGSDYCSTNQIKFHGEEE